MSFSKDQPTHLNKLNPTLIIEHIKLSILNISIQKLTCDQPQLPQAIVPRRLHGGLPLLLRPWLQMMEKQRSEEHIAHNSSQQATLGAEGSQAESTTRHAFRSCIQRQARHSQFVHFKRKLVRWLLQPFANTLLITCTDPFTCRWIINRFWRTSKMPLMRVLP